jgi:hypothetical protein
MQLALPAWLVGALNRIESQPSNQNAAIGFITLSNRETCHATMAAIF